MTTTTKAAWRQCDSCGEMTYTDEPEGRRFCRDCQLDQGDHVDINVGEGSPANRNTTYYTGTLMMKWRPGDDLLVEIDGRRVYYEASRVFDVRRAAPATGGF